ncbi:MULTISPECIES: MDR family MFS transporter [Acidiphilium]|uniref:Putative major facilitator superfamily transporter n=1 Tax=Acidiphilium multivorum (strain DSM 11245 / JCM 8867 / NBRC 100883 / AIU 301) TaxID=926570 RepID=F0J3W1_ACIMA|nr:MULTISPECIES: MDR family MFS transporter [Acidiphilium]BAJ82102.1 putative major facilitator superfamily transporter [Acidiphilium multivorum AIU301]GAN74581.1 ABC transporter multidrug permease [Acidiphilium multivorum AIU301]
MEYTHRQRLQVISGIILCILLAAIDQTVVIPAVPAMAAGLHGFSHLSWVVTAYLLTSTATTPLYGRLSDQFGRRQTLIPSIALFVLASCVCATAETLPWLIAGRALQGVGGGGLMAIAQAAIADVVSPRERGKYQAYMAGTWGVASTAGPVVGGWVTDHLSWQWIFWFNVPLGLAALVLSQIGLRQLRTVARGGRIDYEGAALLTCAVTAFLIGLSWGGRNYPWLSAPVIGIFAAGFALIAALWRWEARAAVPLLPMRLFGSASFVRLVGIGFLTALAMFSAIFLLPLFFQLVYRANAAQSGWDIMPFMIASTIGAYAAGQVARRTGRTRKLLIGGLVVGTAGFVLLGLLPRATPLGLVVFNCFVMGLGIGFVLPSNLVAVQNAATRHDVGAATATLLLLRAMGGAFGATIAGAVLLLRLGRQIDAPGAAAERAMAANPALPAAFHAAFLITAGFALLGLVAAIRVEDTPLRETVASDGTDTDEADAEPAAIGH